MKLINYIYKNILYFFKNNSKSIKYDDSIKKYDVNFLKVSQIPIKLDVNVEKWVGSVNYNNTMYCIPNKINKILKVDMNNDNISYIDFESEEDGFRWSGGTVYNSKIYCFPRKSNKLLVIDPQNNDSIQMIDLGIDYDNEHHYGGVLNSKGIIIQPPRKNNTVMIIDLNNFTTKEIKISPKYVKFSYSNCFYLDDEHIYFFPECNEKILVFNSISNNYYFIGNKISTMVFSGAISDNCIFGFSGYCKGILKIDLKTNYSKMINCETNFGSNGTIRGINGKLYSIPGNSDCIYEFDPISNKYDVIYKIKSNLNAKCAGGSVSYDGTIYTVPARGNNIYKIEFDKKIRLTDDELKMYNSNY